MWWALSITAVVVAASGLVLKYAMPRLRRQTGWHISWHEFIAGTIVAYVVAIPAVFFVGKAWSTADALSYQEFYNGVETSATVQAIDCRPGSAGGSASSGRSNCHYEYNTGQSYTYTETYTDTETDCDSKGKCKTRTVTKTRTERAYIYYPYTTKEYRYAIADSLGGTYQFPNVFVKDGESYRDSVIPADIPRGDPAEWLDAKQRIEAGNPRPVTRLFDYDNYILASQDELLKTFSQDVERYREEGILPDHTANIKTNPLHGFSGSFADKVSFVGVSVPDETVWQQTLMTFNAALGSQYQGDLHIVLIDAALVDNQTKYLNALKAYWLGDDFGRRALAKNAIIVVAGVQGSEITWAQASTGMPFGNETMLRGIMNFLPGTLLDPAQVIGSPRTVVTPVPGSDDSTVTVTLGSTPGVLEQVVLHDFPFKRACMKCKGDGDSVGYEGLIAKIEPRWWQWTIMISVVTVLALAYWTIAAKFELFGWLPWLKSSTHSSDDEGMTSRYARGAMASGRTSRKKRRRGAFYF